MFEFIAHHNIENFRKALAKEVDENKRLTLLRLIAEEELKLAAALQKNDNKRQDLVY